MTDIAAENLRILAERWPDLAARVRNAVAPEPLRWAQDGTSPALEVVGLRLWSAYDADAEARLQAELVPANSGEAWVYGVGGGDLIRVLLHRPALARANVVVLHPGLLHLLLHLLDHRDWLADPRVQMHDGVAQRDVQTPFAAVPACIALSDPACNGLRERLTQELERPFQWNRIDRREPLRRRQIMQNQALVAADGDVAELFGTAPGATVFLAIAGPSLADTADWLRRHRDQGILLSVDGALRPLLDQGLVPDCVISVDDNRRTVMPYFAGDLAACADRTLVYAPVVHNDILTRWPGRRLATYTWEPIYDELRRTHPRAELFVAGSVTHRAVDLAAKMGAARIHLCGADFGFPNGQIHANRSGPVDFYAKAARAGTTTLDGHGEPIATMSSFNGYRLSLERFIEHHPQIDFVNMSRDGARIQGARYLDEAQ